MTLLLKQIKQLLCSSLSEQNSILIDTLDTVMKSSFHKVGYSLTFTRNKSSEHLQVQQQIDDSLKSNNK